MKSKGLNMPNEVISLSFFPLLDNDFSFSIYRKVHMDTSEMKPEGTQLQSLPTEASDSRTDLTYQKYWVSFEQIEGFEEFHCHCSYNFNLTKTFLDLSLLKKCKESINANLRYEEKRFTSDLAVILSSFPEGDQAIRLSAYYLHAKKKFGYLVDFHFYQKSEVSRRTLELSLSLKNGYKNKDFYRDRFDEIQKFVRRYHNRIFPLDLGNKQIDISKNLEELESISLEQKLYEFKDGKTINSQFSGVKDFGVLRKVIDPFMLFFIFQEKDRDIARDLLKALKGDSFATFLGMKKMFDLEIEGNVGGLSVKEMTREALLQVKAEMETQAKGKKIFPVVIGEFGKGNNPETSERYFRIKNTLLEFGWSSQFITSQKIRDKTSLKWSASNIGLQIFAKLGGQPWKIKTKTENCLIIGISQSHSYVDDKIKKYFAYSIQTDSSGIYKDLRILSQEDSEETYLSKLQETLKELILHFSGEYSNFVIHTTFKIKHRELEVINKVISDLHEDSKAISFTVIKFNDKNDYFGYALTNNSLVPYEGTCVALSEKEYLVWFEGLSKVAGVVSKQFERPLHLEFWYPKNFKNVEVKIKHIQDAVNLSGANLRGFNAKSMPISIYYAKLVSDYLQDFEDLGLKTFMLEDKKPWFL
jgi:Piwi domain